MKILVFSDHTADMGHAQQSARQTQNQKALSAHQGALVHHRMHLQRLSRSMRQSWSGKRYFAAIGQAIQYAFVFALGRPKPPELLPDEPNETEKIYKAGRDGEQRVDEHLSGLDDNWTLIAGYCNARGEIDRLLVGPSGVMAIEVKTINGHVSCDGDRWLFDKYDQYGNLVQTNKPLADRTGRSPSRQINECADALQSRLRRLSILQNVQRGVVLAHPKSKIRHLNNITVNFVCTLDRLDIERLAGQSTERLSAQQVASLLQIVRQDHDFHQRNRQRSR